MCLDNVYLEMSLKIVLELVYDGNKQEFSCSTDFEMLKFKGTYGLSRNIVSGILSFIVPILKYKNLGIIPPEIGQLISELPESLNIQGNFDVSNKIQLESLQCPMYKDEKVCHMIGFSPVQLVMFIGFQKSMRRKRLIKTIDELISYRQKYENENQWEILKIFWDQACVVYYSRIAHLDLGIQGSSEDLNKIGVISFEKLLLGAEEICSNPVDLKFSISNIGLYLGFSSIMRNFISMFNRWCEFNAKQTGDLLYTIRTQFLKDRISKNLELLQNIIANLRQNLTKLHLSALISLYGGERGSLNLLLNNLHAVGSPTVLSRLPVESDLGYHSSHDKHSHFIRV